MEAVASWAGIATGLAAIVGLFFAAHEIRASSKARNAEDKRQAQREREFRVSMARAVGMDAHRHQGGVKVHVKVQNAGQYPVEKVRIYLATDTWAAHDLADAPEEFRMSYSLGTLLPGAEKAKTVPCPPGSNEDLPILLEFVDTWDRKWRKTWNGELVGVGLV